MREEIHPHVMKKNKYRYAKHKFECIRIHRYVFPTRMKSLLVFIFEVFQSNM